MRLRFYISKNYLHKLFASRGCVILSIGESRPKKWKVGAQLIKLVEGTDHTHSFVSWRDPGLNIRKVAEARGGGGRIVINTQFKAENEVVRIFQYKISEEKAKELEIWIWKNMGPYGYKHMIGLGLMRLENWVRNALGLAATGNRFKDGAYSQVCVELTAKALELALNTDFPGNAEDYGLLEMHRINFANYHNNLCDLASDEMIKDINAG
jgi:hypothetical protein